MYVRRVRWRCARVSAATLTAGQRTRACVRRLGRAGVATIVEAIVSAFVLTLSILQDDGSNELFRAVTADYRSAGRPKTRPAVRFTAPIRLAQFILCRKSPKNILAAQHWTGLPLGFGSGNTKSSNFNFDVYAFGCVPVCTQLSFGWWISVFFPRPILYDFHHTFAHTFSLSADWADSSACRRISFAAKMRNTHEKGAKATERDREKRKEDDENNMTRHDWAGGQEKSRTNISIPSPNIFYISRL